MLSNHHRLRHGKAQLPCCLLLQCGGGKRGCRTLLNGTGRNILNTELGITALREEGLSLLLSLKAAIKFSLEQGNLSLCIGNREVGRDTIGSKENNYEELAYETVKLEVSIGDNPYRGDDIPMMVAKRDQISDIIIL